MNDDVPLTVEEIENSTDIEHLKDNYLDCFDAVESIRIQIESYRFAGIADPKWLQRATTALVANRNSMKRTERRLLELGSAPDYPPTDVRAAEIRKLQKSLEKANAEIALLKGGRKSKEAA